MTGNKTFTMIKPNAVEKGFTGAILAKINEGGFRIVALKKMRLTAQQAESFYEVHRDRPFFSGLVEFMTSGAIIAAILEKDNAVEDYRRLIGATNPDQAERGTVRNLFGTNVQMNAVHGSDSDENAEIEANFFFSKLERF